MCEVPVVAETSRKLQQTGAPSLWWESLPEPLEAGTGMWGDSLQWQLHGLYTTQQWCLISKADHSSSRSIPSCGAPHSCPLRLSLCSQQWSSPRICSPNPMLSNQPLPALVDSHLWLWHPGLIPDEALAWAVHASPPGSIQPKEALAVAVLRTPGPAWVEEALASGMDEPAQMGAPLSAHKGRGR